MHFGRDGCGHRRHDAAVGEQATFVLHGFHQSRKSAAGAYGNVKRPAGKYVRLTGFDIRGDDRGWDGEVLYVGSTKPIVYELPDSGFSSITAHGMMEGEKV